MDNAYKKPDEDQQSFIARENKLTDWKDEPSVMALEADLQVAKSSRDDMVNKIESWLDLRDGKRKGKPKKNRSNVQPKLVRRQNEWRIPSLSEPFLSSEELFNLKPNTFEDRESARQQALVLDWQWRTQLDRVDFVDEYVRTTVDEGTCFVRVGWDRQTKKVTRQVPVYGFVARFDEEYIQNLQQVLTLKQENPREFQKLDEIIKESATESERTGQFLQAVETGEVAEVEEEIVICNKPTLDIIDYRNIYLDPSCNGNVQKAKFAVITFETSRAELQKNQRYKNLNKVNWKHASPQSTPDHYSRVDEAHQFRDDLRRTVVAHEYWGWYDIHGTGELVFIVATWIGNVMVRLEESPFPFKRVPIARARYNPKKKSVAGEPDAELLGDNQDILGAVTRGMIDLLGRSANGQRGFSKGFLDPLQRKRYESGEDYEFNPTLPPAAAVMEHSFPEIPNSAITMYQMQNAEAEGMTGTKAFSGGLSGDTYGKAVSNARQMLDAAGKREMSILRRLVSGMVDIARMITEMNTVFLEEELIIRVTNEASNEVSAEPTFETIYREDLNTGFDILIDISTAELDDMMAKDIQFLLQTLGNTIPFEITKMLLVDLARLMRRPALAKGIESFEPQPDPIQQKLAELEVQAKELELRETAAKVQELETQAQLNAAKAQREMSEAHKADLDYVEQETGTTHLRDLDKQGAQAKANQDLEIVKGIMSNGEDAPSPDQLARATIFKELQDPLT